MLYNVYIIYIYMYRGQRSKSNVHDKAIYIYKIYIYKKKNIHIERCIRFCIDIVISKKKKKQKYENSK